MSSTGCIHINISIEIIYYSKNLVVGHIAKWKLWSEVEGRFISLRKREVQKNFLWRTVIGRLTNRGNSKLKSGLSSKLWLNVHL